MSNQPRILVIDDEPQIIRALKTILTAGKFQVLTAMTGEEGLTLAASQKPDLIILDLSLPDMNGMQVCQQIRQWTQTPIIVLSVRDGEQDKVQALDKGADDYLTKPFGIEELMARIRVALRHAAQTHSQKKTTIRAQHLEIDLVEFTVRGNRKLIKITATEFKLLSYLAANAGRVLTHRNILSNVWDPADADHIEYLRVFIRQLRKKLETNPEEPQIIVNEPGIGYRFIADE